MKDLTILMDTKQGRPAQMLAGLVEQGVRIAGACLFPRLEGRVAHIAVEEDDVATVRLIVADHGGTVADERDCIVVPSGTPGGAVTIARKVAEAGLTAYIVYFGAEGEMILGTNDVPATRAALGLV